MKKAPYEVPASKKIRVLIDTDCACEADDQYAVAHQLMTPKFDVVGINAAHFNTRFGMMTVAESARRSFDEARKVVDLMGLHDEVKVYHGCADVLPDEKTPVDSEASRFIIEEAMKEDERPLFITVQGAITNVASAYLMKPEIAGRATVIWIGGGAYPEGEWEFNACNDINAANVIMDSPFELWQVPKNVYSMMKVSFATLYDRVYPYGEIGKYIVDYMVNTINQGLMGTLSTQREQMLLEKGYSRAGARASYPGGESWQVGDSPVVGLMLTDHDGHYTMEGAPRFDPETGRYLLRPGNPHKIRVYNYVDNHFILEDFFAKIKYYFG
ncbi:MAG: nucleoside hydrolase [Lachnospiraceae bacterium]|nr:nucleoside hydrolase [Lachnospiraceae bacterium]